MTPLGHLKNTHIVNINTHSIIQRIDTRIIHFLYEQWETWASQLQNEKEMPLEGWLMD